MNIKSLFLFGMLAIPTGICTDNLGDNNECGDLFGGFFSGTNSNFLANINQCESTSQQNQIVLNQVASVNDVQGNNAQCNNCEQQFVTLLHQSGLKDKVKNTNNEQLFKKVAILIQTILNEFDKKQYAMFSLIVAEQKLRSNLNSSQNMQSVDPLQFLVAVLDYIFSSSSKVKDDLLFVTDTLAALLSNNMDEQAVMRLCVQTCQSATPSQRKQMLRAVLFDTNNTQPNSLFNS